MEKLKSGLANDSFVFSNLAAISLNCCSGVKSLRCTLNSSFRLETDRFAWVLCFLLFYPAYCHLCDPVFYVWILRTFSKKTCIDKI